jgi:beta-glucanase (GH16 family)
MISVTPQETNNLEWYDPEALTTSGGALVVTFSQKLSHDLYYQGGEFDKLKAIDLKQFHYALQR